MTWDDLRAAALRASRLGGGSVSDYETLLAHESTALGDPWFNEAQPVTLAASAQDQLVVAFVLPPGMLGILRAFACGVQMFSDFDRIRWRVRINRVAVPGFDSILGPISTFLFPMQVLFPIFKDSSVDVVASNLTAAPIPNVTALVRGTYFPGLVEPAD